MDINFKRKLTGLHFVEEVLDESGKKIGAVLFNNKCQLVLEVLLYSKYLRNNCTDSFNSIIRAIRDLQFLYDYMNVSNIQINEMNQEHMKGFIGLLKIIKVKKETDSEIFEKNKYAIERSLQSRLQLVSHYKNPKIRPIDDEIYNLDVNSINRIYNRSIDFLRHLIVSNLYNGYFNLINLPNKKEAKGMLKAEGVYPLTHEIVPVDAEMIFTDEQLKLITDEASKCNGYIKLLLFILEKTGMRIGEALGIRIECIDYNDIKKIKGDIFYYNGKWTINIVFRPDNPSDSLSKGHFNRTVELSSDVQYTFEMLLTRFLKWRKRILNRTNQNWLFVSRSGTKLSQNTAYVLFKRILERCYPFTSEKLTLHSFRHTFCTNEIKKGTPLEFIAKVVGHKSPQTTFETYIHISGLAEKDIRLKYSKYVEYWEKKYERSWRFKKI